MAKIDVYPDELTSLQAKLKTISSLIDDAEQLAAAVQRNLDFEVATKAGIDSGLSKVRKSLNSHSKKVWALSDLAALSGEEFRIADKETGKRSQGIMEAVTITDAAILSGTAAATQTFLNSVEMSRYKNISDAILTAGSIMGATVLGGWVNVLRNILPIKPAEPAAPVKPSEPVKPVQPVKPVSKPVFTDTKSSCKNAGALGMTYYTQGKGYNKAWNEKAWIGSKGVSYADKRSSACDICCDSMVASHFGIKMTPGDWLQANNGSYKWFKGAHKAMEQQGLKRNTVATQKMTPKARQSKLDECLAKYQNDPKHNGPPMVGIYNKGEGSNHYVLVVGKDTGGNYIIIDPANDGRTTLKVTAQETGKGSKTGYTSCIKDVITWTKK